MNALHTRIEEPLTRAVHLHDLAAWVTRARDFIELVQLRAKSNEPLIKALEGIPLYGANWEEPEQAGLEYLELVLGEQLHEIQREVSAEFAAVRAQGAQGAAS